MGKQIEDKGLPAPPRGSELQHLNYLQIQKYFTLALLVLLVTNIMSGYVVNMTNIRYGTTGDASIVCFLLDSTLKTF